MAHYGDDEVDTEESMCSEEDSNDENEYFHSKPRRINFDDSEFGNENIDGDDGDGKEETVPKQKRKKLLGDEMNKKFSCDVCNKFFDKRWALNSHMLLHSGFVVFYDFFVCGRFMTISSCFSDKPFRCTYVACTKQYADR